MNDLTICLTYTHDVLFADDTSIYTSSESTIDLHHNIYVDLGNLVDWFRSNKLANLMLFTNNNNIPTNQFIKIYADIIESRNCCKF